MEREKERKRVFARRPSKRLITSQHRTPDVHN